MIAQSLNLGIDADRIADPVTCRPTGSNCTFDNGRAFALAECGFAIFPCNYDKTPKTKWRDHSTTDAAVIAGWGHAWSGSLLAIDCGKSGIVVVDVDCHESGPDGLAAWEALVAANGLPLGVPMVRTPSGGLHIYFSQPAKGKPFTNAEGSLAGRGINVRGVGGYVIAPGSKLPDGRGWYPVSGTPDLVSI